MRYTSVRSRDALLGERRWSEVRTVPASSRVGMMLRRAAKRRRDAAISPGDVAETTVCSAHTAPGDHGSTQCCAWACELAMPTRVSVGRVEPRRRLCRLAHGRPVKTCIGRPHARRARRSTSSALRPGHSRVLEKEPVPGATSIATACRSERCECMSCRRCSRGHRGKASASSGRAGVEVAEGRRRFAQRTTRQLLGCGALPRPQASKHPRGSPRLASCWTSGASAVPRHSTTARRGCLPAGGRGRADRRRERCGHTASARSSARRSWVSASRADPSPPRSLRPRHERGNAQLSSS